MGKKYLQKRLRKKEERLKQKLKEKELAKEKMDGEVTGENKMDCGCGRSPTGKCIGWHKLSEEEYQEKLKEYKDKELAKRKTAE